MEKISEEKLLENLRQLKSRPDKQWQMKTRERLQIFSGQDVTGYQNPRMHKHTLFYFLSLNFMQTKRKILVIAATTVLVLGSVGGVTVFAADAARPGDVLFGLDKALENVSRSTITDKQQKLDFEAAILKERESELESIKQSGASTDDANEEVNEQEDRITEVENEVEDSNDLNSTGTPKATELPEGTEKPEGTERPESTERPEASEKPESENEKENSGSTRTPEATERPEPSEIED